MAAPMPNQAYNFQTELLGAGFMLVQMPAYQIKPIQVIKHYLMAA
jgi:hypothetical protein